MPASRSFRPITSGQGAGPVGPRPRAAHDVDPGQRPGANCDQITQPPNGSFSGTPSRVTRVRPAPDGAMARRLIPWVVGLADRLEVRRNSGDARRLAHEATRPPAGSWPGRARPDGPPRRPRSEAAGGKGRHGDRSPARHRALRRRAGTGGHQGGTLTRRCRVSAAPAGGDERTALLGPSATSFCRTCTTRLTFISSGRPPQEGPEDRHEDRHTDSGRLPPVRTSLRPTNHPYLTGAWTPLHEEVDAIDLRGHRGRDPDRHRRRLSAQHREPGAPAAGPLPSVRRRRHAAPDRLQGRRAPAIATASSARAASRRSRRPARRCGAA